MRRDGNTAQVTGGGRGTSVLSPESLEGFLQLFLDEKVVYLYRSAIGPYYRGG